MAEHIFKRHTKSLLIFHLVCPVKYRRKVFTDEVAESLKLICLELGVRYEYKFLEIGIDEDHIHFLIQTVPNVLISGMVNTIKSITGRMIFEQHPEVKTFLWKRKFWTDWYYINTVGRYGNLDMITHYVKNQGIESYTEIHYENPTLFD